MKPPTTPTPTTTALDLSPPPMPAPGSAPSAPGPACENFHHYQILRRPDGTLHELGRGAMGVTYKAFDVNLRSAVALKVVSPHALADETVRARFVREARAAARLRHRNVASVYHLGQDGQCFFYAMEFVDGETLEMLVRRDGPLPAAEAMRLAVQGARALGAAHREGLVHRDIKPANLMVMRDEDEDCGLLLKVIDFGLARTALSAVGSPAAPADGSGAGLSALTHTGFVGTPLFASPEQLEEHEVDIRSDIYSLGVTLWYALTGAAPFTGSLAGIISQHLTREPPWEKLDNLSVPAPVREILMRMLQKDRDQRPADPLALRRELDEVLQALPPEAPDDSTASADPLASPRPLRPRPAPRLPSTDAPLGDRYQIERTIGDGSAGRVFLARDLAASGRAVALKMLHADLLVTPDDESALAELVARARAAAHPNLLETFSLERDGGRHFLVQESLRGFNLITLLRNRGALDAADTLRLLDDAAAGFDHARTHGLSPRRLELGLHQILLHFPDAAATAEPVPVPPGPLAGWPAFHLKIDPLGVGREAAGGDPLLTWTGDQTLVPTPPPAAARLLTRDTQSSIILPGAGDDGHGDDLAAGLRALSQLAYALLGGTTGPVGNIDSPERYTSLPALSERANAALRRGLLGKRAASEGGAREFVETLRSTDNRSLPAVAAPVISPAPVRTRRMPATRRPEPAPPTPPTLVPTTVPSLTMAPRRPGSGTRAAATAVGGAVPVRFTREDGAADSAAAVTNTSIAHFLLDPPPRRGGSPILAALVVLGLFGALAAGGWWFASRYLIGDFAPPETARSPAASRIDQPSAAAIAAAPQPSPSAGKRATLAPPPAPKTADAAANTPAPLPPPARRGTAPTPAPTPAIADVASEPASARNPARRESSPVPMRALPEPSPATTAQAPPVATPAAPVGPPVRRVRVNLFSEPAGAELTLGGQSLGVAPQTITLPPGEYTVRARYGDWPESSRVVRVPAEGVDSVDARIKLLPLPGALAPMMTSRSSEDAGTAAPSGSEVTNPRVGGGGSRREPVTSDRSPESQALPAIPVPAGGTPSDGDAPEDGGGT